MKEGNLIWCNEVRSNTHSMSYTVADTVVVDVLCSAYKAHTHTHKHTRTYTHTHTHTPTLDYFQLLFTKRERERERRSDSALSTEFLGWKYLSRHWMGYS